jgi:hypothetical protein
MVRIPSRSAAALVHSAFPSVKKPLAVARPVDLDKLESFRKPVIDLRPTPKDLGNVIERVMYKKSIEAMSPAELKEEALKVDEQLEEASTGRAQDPEAKAEAEWKRALIDSELKRRQLEDPDLSVKKYERLIAKLPDNELKAEVKRLEAELKDATSGAHTNEADAGKIREKLAAARSEQAQRVVDDPDTNILSYALAVPKLSDKALTAEQAQVRSEYDATLKQLAAHPEKARELTDKLEALARKLNLLDAGMKARGLTPASEVPERPVTDAAESLGEAVAAGAEAAAQAEAVAAAAAEAAATAAAAAATEAAAGAAGAEAPAEPKSEPYTVVEGDSVSAIAMRISAENGGTPDWQTVMGDMLELNDLPNPDLILVDQVLQLPVY